MSRSYGFFIFRTDEAFAGFVSFPPAVSAAADTHTAENNVETKTAAQIKHVFLIMGHPRSFCDIIHRAVLLYKETPLFFGKLKFYGGPVRRGPKKTEEKFSFHEKYRISRKVMLYYA